MPPSARNTFRLFVAVYPPVGIARALLEALGNAIETIEELRNQFLNDGEMAGWRKRLADSVQVELTEYRAALAKGESDERI